MLDLGTVRRWCGIIHRMQIDYFVITLCECEGVGNFSQYCKISSISAVFDSFLRMIPARN